MTTTPESWEQCHDAAHATPDNLRNRLYAESWSDGTGHRAVDLDRAAEIAHAEIDPLLREIDEARLELTRWQSMFGDVDTAQTRLDGLEAINKELRDENARLQEQRANELETKREAVREARRVISQYLVTAEQWRYDRVMWAFAIMLGEIPEDTPEPLSPADAEARAALSEPAADTTPEADDVEWGVLMDDGRTIARVQGTTPSSRAMQRDVWYGPWRPAPTTEES